jgi:two-component system chemotaxis sensor kinase CheA
MREIQFTESDLEELRTTFFQQVREILDALPASIMAVESDPSEENWKTTKRLLHTVKGDSKAIGFGSLSTLAHKTEDLVNFIKGREIDKASIDLLLKCADSLEIFTDTIAQGEEPEVTETISMIDSYIAGGTSRERKNETIEKKIAQRDAALLKIEPERLDMMMNRIGELVILHSMLGHITSDAADLDRESVTARLEGINLAFERSLADLQRSVMKVRMLPVGQVFRRFPRAVRDLSHETGKKVRLRIEGENTEVDKSIVDVIGEPILHLIRNAVDHGIEAPEERVGSGKPEEGIVCLRAFHQGNQIIIEIEDDGRGIDPDIVKERAVRNGILSAEEARNIGPREAIKLIFSSGFSTAEKVSEVSGRGVGMDIVKETVESLRGMTDIYTEKGKGTKITLRLPLTLAIIKAILFRKGSGTFAFPLSSVTEILRVMPESVDTITGAPVIRHREEIIPLIAVNRETALKRRLFVIIVGVAHQRAGIVAEEILGEKDIVIKALDEGTASDIVAGASILGDGKIVLIIDPLLLMKKTAERSRTEFAWST